MLICGNNQDAHPRLPVLEPTAELGQLRHVTKELERRVVTRTALGVVEPE